MEQRITEDALQFAQERLRHHPTGPMGRGLGKERRPRVTRRLAVELPQGVMRTFERVDASVRVHCSRGSVWITHDGDCKDVILSGAQCYQAEREAAMHLHALQDTVLELEFEDDVLPQA